MNSLKITQIGNSLGVVLPKEMLARLNVTKGDELFMSRTPHGVVLTTTDPEFEHQMTLAREIMRDYRDALAELAK
jgi:putative addiction module antidote